MTSRRRQPRPVAEAIRAAASGVEPATLLGAVQSIWPAAAGDRIAAEATPVAERGGVVTVACRTASWAHELELLGPEIGERLRAELPPESDFEGLRFTVGSDSD